MNWLKTPDLLKLWGVKEEATCKLCNAPQCTVHHILVDCPVALKDKRYTRRHDSVLLTIQQTLCPFIGSMNSRNKPALIPHISESFVSAKDSNKPRNVRATRDHYGLLEGASDWKALVDFRIG